MNPKLFSIPLLLILCSCSEKADIESAKSAPLAPKRRALSEDFIMGSWTAVSNATHFMSPPDGWAVVCDDSGHYAARSPDGYVVDIKSDYTKYVRTNYFEATVVAWRTKEIWDTPRPPMGTIEHSGFNWKECDK